MLKSLIYIFCNFEYKWNPYREETTKIMTIYIFYLRVNEINHLSLRDMYILQILW